MCEFDVVIFLGLFYHSQQKYPELKLNGCYHVIQVVFGKKTVSESFCIVYISFDTFLWLIMLNDYIFTLPKKLVTSIFTRDRRNPKSKFLIFNTTR